MGVFVGRRDAHVILSFHRKFGARERHFGVPFMVDSAITSGLVTGDYAQDHLGHQRCRLRNFLFALAVHITPRLQQVVGPQQIGRRHGPTDGNIAVRLDNRARKNDLEPP